MKKTINYLVDRPKLLIIILCGLIWILIEIISTSLGTAPARPQITIKNPSPCLSQDSKWIPVDSLSIHDKQYICADLKSDTHPIHITLLIYKENDALSVYSTDDQFTGNSVFFQLSLPPGNYRGKIMYARRVLAEFKFEVIE